jgi:hypothetical protein
MILGAQFIGPASTEVDEAALHHSALNGFPFFGGRSLQNRHPPK